MADLSRDRGQILLIAALTLAVIFVGLALVVNGAIFTQNLASQGEGSGGGELLELRAQTVQSVGDTLDYVNEHGGNSTATLNASFTENLSQQERRLQNFSLVGGRVVSLGFVSNESGRYIEDVAPPPNDFVGGANGSADWKLGSKFNETRALRFYLQNATAEVDNNEFTLLVTDTTNKYTLSIGNNSSTSPIRPMLKVNATGSKSGTCTVRDRNYPVRLNVMNAQFGGEYCAALDRIEFAENVGSSPIIKIRNGDQLFGNYSMVATPVSLDDPEYGTRSSKDPFVKEAFYGVSLNLTVRTADLTYEDSIRVAPGETDD